MSWVLLFSIVVCIHAAQVHKNTSVVLSCASALSSGPTTFDFSLSMEATFNDTADRESTAWSVTLGGNEATWLKLPQSIALGPIEIFVTIDGDCWNAMQLTGFKLLTPQGNQGRVQDDGISIRVDDVQGSFPQWRISYSFEGLGLYPVAGTLFQLPPVALNFAGGCDPGAQFSLDLSNPAVVFASSSVCAGQATFASGKVFVENGEKHTVAIHDRVKKAATRK